MLPKPKPTRQPHVLSEKFADPDLVDRIFAYILTIRPDLAGQHQEVKKAVRNEFKREITYVRQRSFDEPNPTTLLAKQVLQLFNGRNASEVARALGISRATVYRRLKQPGRAET